MSTLDHRAITAETLIRNIPSILLVFDGLGKLSTWNEAATLSMGLGTPPAQDGQTCDISAVLDKAVQSCMEQASMMRVEQCAVLVDGVERRFGFTANPLLDGDKSIGAVVTGRDITERLKITEEIDDLRRRAGIEKVARQVAHELRNPLNSIKVHSQYLELTFPDGDPSRHYARIISEEVDKMDRLLGGLRDLARAQELNLRFGSPEEAITQACELLRPVAKAKGVAIKLRLGLVPNVLHDSDKLTQVFVNMLKNAVEAVGAGQHVQVRAGSTNAGGLFVEVLDDGPGIDPAAAGHVFDLFYSTKGGTGEGVGLTVCQEIVERHRGSIALLSEPGWSTCFRVEIPPP